MFADPATLPPSRAYDHAIHLVPGAAPVNSRPYRYSPLQKDEMERQVQEMIKAGIISPSLSPFASPVLRVKKRMVHGDFVLIIENSMPLLSKVNFLCQ